MTSADDTVDLREVGRALRSGWRWIAAGAAAGLLVAILAIALMPPRYESATTVLLRSGAEPGGSMFGAARTQSNAISIGGLASVLSLASGFETEIEILTSRSVIEAVADSLGLQAQVISPRRRSPLDLFADARWPRVVERPIVYRFRRDGEDFVVEGPRGSSRTVPGQPFRDGVAEFSLRRDGLPDEFRVRVHDRIDTVERLARRLRARRAGGEVASVRFRSADPRTAAAVPNAVVDRYLSRRATTDRGVNQRRYEFLQRHADSVRAELGRAERSLREEQEGSGVLDPEMFGQAELEKGLELRARLENADVEARALREVLVLVRSGVRPIRDLAAYPTFLTNHAVSQIMASLTALESDRTQLVDRRTEQDPDVILLDRRIRQHEDQLVSTARAYLEGLDGQIGHLKSELRRYAAVTEALPAQAESNYRAQREVLRLSETLVALEGELVQARLAAIAEGGDVRQVDAAVPPRRVAFPGPPWIALGGLVLGVVLGMGGALGTTYLGNRIREPLHAELTAGVPVVPFDGRAPLLLKHAPTQQTVLFLPVGAGTEASPVAHRMAITAARQGVRVIVAEFEQQRSLITEVAGIASERVHGESRALTPTAREAEDVTRHEAGDGGVYFVYRGGGNGAEIRQAVEDLEGRFSLVLVTLPAMEAAPTEALLGEERAVVLVARLGGTRRSELRDVVRTLGRIDIVTSGVVLCSRTRNGDRGH